jgi:hypothetical protein
MAKPYGFSITDEKLAEHEEKFAALSDEQANWFRQEMVKVKENITAQLEKVTPSANGEAWDRWANQTEIKAIDSLLEKASGRKPRLSKDQILNAAMLYVAYREVMGEMVTPEDIIREITLRDPLAPFWVRDTIMENVGTVEYMTEQLYALLEDGTVWCS